jgi:hypothetical protein
MHLIAKPILPAGTVGLGEVELVPSSGPNKTMQEVTIDTTRKISIPMTIHFVNFPRIQII